jgi:hypothetical protein
MIPARCYALALAATFAMPAQAQHLTPESIAKVFEQAKPLDNARTTRVPAGLPLTAALFADRPWWAVMILCAEHRAGNGTAPGSPKPVLNDALEKNRKFFIARAASIFAREQDLPNFQEALLPVSGWGTEFALVMEAEAKAGRWSSRETEDACRILGVEQLKASRAPS